MLENIYLISTSESYLPAKRPANLRLDTRKSVNTFGVYPPPRQSHVERLVAELIRKETS